MKKKLLISALAFVLAANLSACGMTTRTDMTTDTNTGTNRANDDQTLTERMDASDREDTAKRNDSKRENDMTPDFNDGYVKDNHADDGVVDDRAGRHLYNAELMR